METGRTRELKERGDEAVKKGRRRDGKRWRR